MFELYLITRLDGISNLLRIITVGSVFVAVGLLISSIILYADANSDKERSKSTIPRGWGIRLLILALVIGTIKAFIPTTKEALIIYGVGGTIEYLQENPTSKELPDKVIKCIDKLLNEYLIEEPESQNTKDS
jgi:fructose-specific phosphotransferase system IIC component